jgi:hypothetical protein
LETKQIAKWETKKKFQMEKEITIWATNKFPDGKQ